MHDNSASLYNSFNKASSSIVSFCIKCSHVYVNDRVLGVPSCMLDLFAFIVSNCLSFLKVIAVWTQVLCSSSPWVAAYIPASGHVDHQSVYTLWATHSFLHIVLHLIMKQHCLCEAWKCYWFSKRMFSSRRLTIQIGTSLAINNQLNPLAGVETDS
jgi:hypothetical protein